MRRRLIRLLRYSTYGWDKLPISQRGIFCSSMRRRLIRLLRYSTYRWDKLPISKKGIFSRPGDDELFDRFGTRFSDGTNSLSPNKNLVIQEVTIHRLLHTRCREGTKLLIPTMEPLVHKTTSKSTTMVLKEMIHDSQRQASWKRQLANQPSNKRKKYYTTEY